jgi:hypothetical protein
MAVSLLNLGDDGGLGQREDAPVVDAADDTAVLDDEAADGASDPGVSWLDGPQDTLGEGSVLLDFGKAAWSDLVNTLADSSGGDGPERPYNCY